MARSASDTKTKKPVKRAVKPRVPKAEAKIPVLHLRCTNCGEEEEKVVYCSQCDAPMEVAEIKGKDLEDVEGDDTLANREKNGDGGDEEIDSIDDLVGSGGKDVEDIIDSGSLDEIFGGGGSGAGIGGTDSDGEDVDISDIVDALDEE